MKLPNAPFAIVVLEKLRDYSLCVSHEEGKHKAHVFASALGIDADDAEWLRAKLVEAASLYECVPGRKTPHGQRYVLDFPVTRATQQAQIRSVWNVRPGETVPRLITCYVL